jgi:hypothetical protein
VLIVRIPGSIRASLAAACTVVAALLLMPISLLASHEPTVEEVVVVATSEQWNMSCEFGSTFVDCTASDFDFTWFEDARIAPGSGPLGSLHTAVTVRSAPLDPYFHGWHSALQDVACAPDRVTAGQLSSFIQTVAERTAAGTDGPVTIGGECTVTGGLRVVFSDSVAEYTYWLQSSVILPPRPTPLPTVHLTPKPIDSPPPLPTTAPTAATTPTTTAVATTSPSPSSASPTPSPPLSTSPAASSTPEQSVLAGNPSPTPSAQAAGAPSASDDGLLRPGALAASVAGPSEISLEPATLASSAGLAVVLLLFLGFTSELFNSTVESNYDEIAGWLRLRRGAPPGRIGRLWASPVGVGLFLALGALIYVLLDPALALDLESVAVYLGMLAGLGVVMLAFEAPALLLYRRRTGASAGVRALPWTLPAAALCVIVSRVAGLEPGYLYGLLLGLVFKGELTAGQEGRQTAAGAAWTMAVAVAAWIGLGLLRSAGLDAGQFGALLLETALAVVAVGGLEAVAFGLLPMRFLSGAAVYAWSRLGWAILFGLGVFAFIHLLVGPNTGYLADLSPAALIAALGAFATFGAFSVLFWAYFRFRPARVSPRG